jgi:hypothetical protein
MECPRCNNPLEEAAAFCGHCGALLKPRLGTDFGSVSGLPDSTAPTILSRPNTTQPPLTHFQPDIPSNAYDIRDVLGKISPRQRGQGTQPSHIMSQYQQPSTSAVLPPVQSGRGRQKLWLVLPLVMIIVGGAIAGVLFWMPRNSAPSALPTATGKVSFFDSQNSVSGSTDSAKISASGLQNPAAGYQYDVWLFDTENEQILSLGVLSKNGTNFALTSTQPGKNLIGQGNEIEITQEQGIPNVPTGKPLLSATLPRHALIHIRHLLARFPATPNQVGLLVGLLNETQKLNTQAGLLQNNLGTNGAQVRQCLAQSMIDIIEGTNGTDYSALASGCGAQNIMEIGDGYGLLDTGSAATSHGYLATAAQHAALAANQLDATDLIRSQANKVEASIDNIKILVEQIKGNALELLHHPANIAQVAEIVSRSDQAYHGFDQNGNGIIEPILGEAGAVTAYTNGQLMAGLTLA